MFLDPKLFPFTQVLVKGWQVIRDECLALPQDRFDPWIQRDLHDDGWSVFGLVALGQRIEAACNQCPQTAQILSSIPDVTLAGFSRLAPGSHIQPHTGWVQSSYRLHLGLVIPDDCKLRVGWEIQPWQEGHCLIFEDTVEHEAWNNSDLTRTVLLIDFRKPGLETIDEIPENILPYANQLLGVQANPIPSCYQ